MVPKKIFCRISYIFGNFLDSIELSTKWESWHKEIKFRIDIKKRSKNGSISISFDQHLLKFPFLQLFKCDWRKGPSIMNWHIFSFNSCRLKRKIQIFYAIFQNLFLKNWWIPQRLRLLQLKFSNPFYNTGQNITSPLISSTWLCTNVG